MSMCGGAVEGVHEHHHLHPLHDGCLVCCWCGDLFTDDAETSEHGEYAPAPTPAPIPMLLTCPACGERHIDEGEFAKKPHHTHACQSCGVCWRPAVVHTVGVQFLPASRTSSRRKTSG
jgi:hypothetical protein